MNRVSRTVWQFLEESAVLEVASLRKGKTHTGHGLYANHREGQARDKVLEQKMNLKVSEWGGVMIRGDNELAVFQAH